MIDAKGNPWNFGENFLRIGGVENLSFFESAILIFFASSPWKLVKVSWATRMGRNFDDYTLVQPKKHMPKNMQRSVHVCVVVQACKLSQLNLTNMYSHGWLKEDLYYGRVLVWYKCHSANKLLSLDVGYGVMDRVITFWVEHEV